MITADKLKTLTSFTAPALSRAINLAGYRDDSFTGAEFLGLTNALQFCYRCTYVEDNETHRVKVFLDYDPTSGSVTADY
jgi:hypothetical protein